MDEHLDWHDHLEDWEYPDDPESVDPEDDQSDLVPCSECGEAIYADSEQCPHCGCYVTVSTSAWAGRSPAWILLGLLGIAAVIVALVLAR